MSKRKEVKEEDGAKSVVGVERERERRGEGMERDDEQGDGAGDGGGGDEGAENVDGGRMDPADNVQEEVVMDRGEGSQGGGGGGGGDRAGRDVDDDDGNNKDVPTTGEGSGSDKSPHQKQGTDLPRYRHETHVQPKFVLSGDTDRNAEKDIIESAFNQGSFVGIRSLPNAFRPDFRQKLYELVLSRKHQQSALSRSMDTSSKDLRACVSYSSEILPGQRKQIPFSGAPRAFSSFTYMSSEYDRPSEMSISQSRVERSRWVSDADFKVTALPQVPSSAGSFNEFHYAIDPYEAGEVSATSERNEMLTKRLFGPLRASGRAAANKQKKILRRECLSRLSDLFAADWGTDVFHSVTEDSGGFIVLKFFADKQTDMGLDAAKRHLRGRDRRVAAYVTNFCQRDSISDEFQLRRDTRRWGVRVRRIGYARSAAADSSAAGNSTSASGSARSTSGGKGMGSSNANFDWLVFYLIPPWVAYDTNPTKGGAAAMPMLRTKGSGGGLQSGTDDMRPCETPLLSSRLPFGPQTNSGNLILAHTRTLNRSFKFV